MPNSSYYQEPIPFRRRTRDDNNIQASIYFRGILIEPEAVQKAEAECLGDAEQRAERRRREALRRAKQDGELVGAMVKSLQKMYPACPAKEAEKIARQTAERGSGRVGRSAAGQNLEEWALELAVAAWVRHRHTEYDDLLARGCERIDARDIVGFKVQEILNHWKGE
jgi:hypothetical protein